MTKTRLAIFASGKGSNAVNIIRHFHDHPDIQIVFVLTNNPEAGVIERSEKSGVPVIIVSNDQANDPDFLIHLCHEQRIDLILLAGYLRLIPEKFARNYLNRIINIHPSLLPKFGGKGMYGDHVHRAVLESGELESGITIHYVNPVYDEGEIIAQFSCVLDENETLEQLKGKVSHLEKMHYPAVIEQIIRQK